MQGRAAVTAGMPHPVRGGLLVDSPRALWHSRGLDARGLPGPEPRRPVFNPKPKARHPDGAACQDPETMQVTETKSEGLSRTFSVTVPAEELSQKLDARIEEIRPKMNLKGFRPGKVPASHVKRMFGKSIMGELIETIVGEANQKALEDARIRPASDPHPHFDETEDMEKVLAGEADLSYELHVDAMPEFEPVDPSTISIERPVTKVDDAAVNEALERIAEQNKQFEARGKTAKARDGDVVVVDFVGKIDGEPFEGGAAEDSSIEIGAGRFIPGFEEQLIGVKTGEETEIEVTFPEDYGAEHLAGKPAVFEITVKEVRAPKETTIDDAFAEGLGFDDLDKLKGLVTDQLQNELDSASRMKAKRALLDKLDEAHAFDLPPKMVDAEFGQIWQQFEQERESGNVSQEDAGKDDDTLKDEYRKIAERRVRLGLVLAEIGQAEGVTISEEEVQQALIAEARKFPGQERQVIEFFQKNPNAMAQLRAPIYEDKVVDLLLERVEVTDTEVDRETLMAEDDLPD